MSRDFVLVQRKLTRLAFDDPSVTFFGIMLHPGSNQNTYLDVFADRPCWRSLLQQQPDFMDLVTLAHVCDSRQAVKWVPGQQPAETPEESTGRDETLVHVELPFADYDTYDVLLKDAEKLLVPENIKTAKVFGEPIHYRKPFEVRPVDLGGQEVQAEIVHLIKHSDKSVEVPMLYERGIPICPIKISHHVNLLAVLPVPVPQALVDDVTQRLS